MKKACHKNCAVELKVRPICVAKWLFLQSFLKIIFIAVLSTAVFWWFLLIPKPCTLNLTYGESVTHNWCPQLVLLHYFAIKVMFKAFYWQHFSIILYGKSQAMLIISWGECRWICWLEFLILTIYMVKPRFLCHILNHLRKDFLIVLAIFSFPQNRSSWKEVKCEIFFLLTIEGQDCFAATWFGRIVIPHNFYLLPIFMTNRIGPVL